MAIYSMNCKPWNKEGEKIEDFHGRILRLLQEINLSGETVYSTIILPQCMEV